MWNCRADLGVLRSILRSSLWLAPEKADYLSAGIRRLLFHAALPIAAYAVMHRTFRISGPPSVRVDASKGGPSKARNTALMWGAKISVRSATIGGHWEYSDQTRDFTSCLGSCFASALNSLGTSMTPSCAIIVARFQFT